MSGVRDRGWAVWTQTWSLIVMKLRHLVVKYCFHTVLLSGLFCCCFFNSRSAVFWAWPWGPGNGSADWGSSQGVWWKLSSSRQSSEHQLLWKPNHIFPGSQWSWKDHNHVSENNFSSCSWVQYKLFLNTECQKALEKCDLRCHYFRLYWVYVARKQLLLNFTNCEILLEIW